MDNKKAFGQALKKIRKARGLTQEDFSNVSSRTYLSTLERGIKSPTLEKVDALAGELNIHPLVLLLLTYAHLEKNDNVEDLICKVRNQMLEI